MVRIRINIGIALKEIKTKGLKGQKDVRAKRTYGLEIVHRTTTGL